MLTIFSLCYQKLTGTKLKTTPTNFSPPSQKIVNTTLEIRPANLPGHAKKLAGLKSVLVCISLCEGLHKLTGAIFNLVSANLFIPNRENNSH